MSRDRLLGACIALLYVVQAMGDELDASDAAANWRDSVRDASFDLLDTSTFSGLSAGEEEHLRQTAQAVIHQVVTGTSADDLFATLVSH
jgi:hypothetical protein